MSDERRAKHHIEIRMIEIKDEQSEMFLKQRCLEDDHEKALQEVTLLTFTLSFSFNSSIALLRQKSTWDQGRRPENWTEKGCKLGKGVWLVQIQ